MQVLLSLRRIKNVNKNGFGEIGGGGHAPGVPPWIHHCITQTSLPCMLCCVVVSPSTTSRLY